MMSMSDLSVPDDYLAGCPAFTRELVGTLAVHAQYVLHGNIRDLFQVELHDGRSRPMNLRALLWETMRRRGYQCFICYDPVDGISVYPERDPAAHAAAETLLGSGVIDRRPSFERLRRHLARTVGVPQQRPLEDLRRHRQPESNAMDATASEDVETPSAVRAAFLIDLAPRLIREPGHYDVDEHELFRQCLKLALVAQPLSHPTAPGDLYNPIIWLTDGDRDLPLWLSAGIESVRTVAVGTPTMRERTRMAETLARRFPASAHFDPAHPEDVVHEFAQRTDGMTLLAMTRVSRMLKDRRIPADRIADAVRIYTLGIEDDKWQGVRGQILRGQDTIKSAVLGQPAAIQKTLDILKRAALGLSGVQAASSASRPRGVLFFAGPTGVGKTELAKQVAALLFGDVDSYLRFDMSEFSAEHAAHRLIGAPPGYVGFEAGGELTGAVRRNPFQVILFDEIEKAHRGIMDKFLQILEDGRLTDGQGVTTYFSECVIIFTSNLGIVEDGKYLVEPGQPYEEIEQKVEAKIREHFTHVLGRPELLNRLGDNIVVFDFITPEIAAEICELRVRSIAAIVEERCGITLGNLDTAIRELTPPCISDLEHGARGIANELESRLINPLARYLFDEDVQPGTHIDLPTVLRDDDGG
jgi:hypothetical protein